jgi:hypothetical protein
VMLDQKKRAGAQNGVLKHSSDEHNAAAGSSAEEDRDDARVVRERSRGTFLSREQFLKKHGRL